MPNQYQQVGNGVSHLGQVAQQIALGLAQQKQQQQQLQMQMQLKLREQAMNEAIAQQRGTLMGQQGRQAESMTGFNNARAGQVANAEQAKTGLGNAAWLMSMMQAEKSLPTPAGTQDSSLPLREQFARGQMMDSMSRLPDASRARLPENMAQMMQMDDERAQQMMATGTKMNANIAPGAMLYDMLNQQQVASSPRTLSPNQALVPNISGSVGPTKQQDPNALLRILQSTIGSVGNVRNAGMALGEAADPNDQVYKDSTAALPVLLGEVMRMITNSPSGGAAPIQAPSGNTRVGLQGGPTQFASPQSKAEFDALPSGALYINPADQKQYRKN